MTQQGSRSSQVRPAHLALPVAMLVAVSVLGVWFLGTQHGEGSGYDLRAYTDAADRLVRSLPLYQPITQQGPFQPGPGGLYLYAPQLAVTLLPITGMTADGQLALWAVLHIGALVLGCAAMPLRRSVRAGTLLTAVLCYPAISDMVLGNISSFVFLGSVLTWRWLERPLGAISLAATMTLRPTMGIVLVTWALRRRWQAIVWTLAAGLVLIVVTLPFVGVDAYRAYVTMFRNLAVSVGIDKNTSLGAGAWQAGVPVQWADLLQLAGYVVALVVLVASARRDAQTAFVSAVGASLLLSPLMWSHYLVSLLLPLAWMVQRGYRWMLLLFGVTWIPVLFSGTNIVYPLLVLIVTLLVAWLPDRRAQRDMPASAMAGGSAEPVSV